MNTDHQAALVPSYVSVPSISRATHRDEEAAVLGVSSAVVLPLGGAHVVLVAALGADSATAWAGHVCMVYTSMKVG